MHNRVNDAVTIGNATLYHGDCRAILPTLPRVAAIVTDPPYGVLDEAWDAMSERELARFTMSWASRTSELSDVAVIFFGERTRRVVCPILERLHGDVRQFIWNKLGGQVAEDKVFYSYESIYYCHENETWEVVEPKALEVARQLKIARESVGLSRGAVDVAVRGKKTGLCFRWEEGACLPTPEQIERLATILPIGPAFVSAMADAAAARGETMQAANAAAKVRAARSVDVFSFPPPNKKRHPTEKPVPLMEELVSVATEPGQSVLDPFMGSGTTGVACMNLGRTFTGIELDRKYFDIACERIAAAQSQQRLFA